MSTKLTLNVEFTGDRFTIDWEKPKYMAGVIASASNVNDIVSKQEQIEFNICVLLRTELERLLAMRQSLFAGRKATDKDAKRSDSRSGNEIGTAGEVGKGGGPVASQQRQQDGDQAGGATGSGEVLGVAQGGESSLPTGGSSLQAGGG